VALGISTPSTLHGYIHILLALAVAASILPLFAARNSMWIEGRVISARILECRFHISRLLRSNLLDLLILAYFLNTLRFLSCNSV